MLFFLLAFLLTFLLCGFFLLSHYVSFQNYFMFERLNETNIYIFFIVQKFENTSLNFLL